MVGGSCKEKILGRMHLLTNTEAKLAAYILEHYEEVLNCNITELAEEAGLWPFLFLFQFLTIPWRPAIPAVQSQIGRASCRERV